MTEEWDQESCLIFQVVMCDLSSEFNQKLYMCIIFVEQY